MGLARLDKTTVLNETDFGRFFQDLGLVFQDEGPVLASATKDGHDLAETLVRSSSKSRT